MGSNDQRDAPFFQAKQAVPKDVTGLRVEAGGWLVEHQNLGLVDEAAGDGQAPLHAARELFGLVVALLLQLREVEQFFDLGLQKLAAQAKVAAVNHEVLPHLEFAVEVVLLRHNSEVRANLWAALVGVFAQNA